MSYVEEDHRVSIQASVVVNDPGYPLQWNLQQLGMPDAWGVTTGNSSVVVVIIDTGIAEDISDFAGTTFVDGWNFVGNNDNTYDDNGHGDPCFRHSSPDDEQQSWHRWHGIRRCPYADKGTRRQWRGILQQTVLGGAPSAENFFYYQGTSMAAPHASALGALLLSRNPLLSPAEIFTAITTTAEDLGTAGKDEYYGYGLISPVAALESVSSGISAYPVSDSINIQYDESEYHSSQWFFNAASGEIHLTLSSTGSSVTMTLYDPEGVEIKSTVEAPEQEVTHNIGASGGEFSVVVH